MQQEPLCGANVGIELRTGRFIRQDCLYLWTGDSRVSSASGRGWKRKGNDDVDDIWHNGRLGSAGTRAWRGGSGTVKKSKDDVSSHNQ